MEGVKRLETIRLENILSYGPDAEPFPLEPLNVLIGPNGSGKSNLIEVLSLLAAAPYDLQAGILAGGGVEDWLWKGYDPEPTARVEVTGRPVDPVPVLSYQLSFSKSPNLGFGSDFRLVGEVVKTIKTSENGGTGSKLHYRSSVPQAEVLAQGENTVRQLGSGEIDFNQSILSQLKDMSSYPELGYTSLMVSNIRFYRQLDVSRFGPARLPQRSDNWQANLLNDGSNLAMVLNNLLNRPPAKAQILERMRDFYPSFSDIVVSVSGGAVQVFFHERGLQHPIPATRLSDGSMRYLCLLAVLCNPDQKGIVCIEEPELGLHPDIIPVVAKLLVEASKRCQLFVTTHSDILVDALTEIPEAVIVCEKPEASTQLRRLSAEEFERWLEEYRLGDLWLQGQLGGTRW